MLLSYILIVIFAPIFPIELDIGRQVIVLLCLLSTVFVVHQMAVKNHLTRVNMLALLFFTGFVSTLGLSFDDVSLLFANVLCVVGVFRLVETNDTPKVKGKFFDAALTFVVASLFFSWCSLFLILVFVVIAINGRRDKKNFFIPFVAIGAVVILLISIENLFAIRLLSVNYSSSGDFSIYNSARIIIPLSFLLTLLIWCLFTYLSVLKRASANIKGGHITILAYLFFAIALVLLSPVKKGSELLFLAAPFSIITANYFQQEGDALFKEILLWIIILLPFSLFLYS
ncbi:DUF6427 family protein [Gangjinia marincola]|uniref:DUF6427 family protein n=2 Tax=Gangjinia marincola TaxID=578463 RepID=A0ABP3XWL3_9FLAO